MNPEIFLSELDGTKPLLSYNLPGAHDCATNYVAFPKLTRCQNQTVERQLCCGVRVLDIRVAPFFGDLILVHSKAAAFETKKKKPYFLGKVIDNCVDFLSSHPSETVVFQFKSDFMDSDLLEKYVAKLFYKRYIEPCKDKWFLENRMPTLDEARGKIVLLRRCLADKSFDTEHFGIDLSAWNDQKEAIPSSEILQVKENLKFEIQDRYVYSAKDRWKHCLEPAFSSADMFDGIYKLFYTSTSGGGAPVENAKYINKKLLDVQLKPGMYYGVVYFDFVNETLAKKIIETNF